MTFWQQIITLTCPIRRMVWNLPHKFHLYLIIIIRFGIFVKINLRLIIKPNLAVQTNSLAAQTFKSSNKIFVFFNGTFSTFSLIKKPWKNFRLFYLDLIVRPRSGLLACFTSLHLPYNWPEISVLGTVLISTLNQLRLPSIQPPHILKS